MKKILILGSKGNLGQQLQQEFSRFPEYSVTSYSREELDILNYDLVNSKISKIKPDAIINTASYNAVDKCEELENEFKLAKKINGEALRHLGKAAINNNAVLVHYSSDYVFGGDICLEDNCNSECLLKYKEKGGFREDDEQCPVNKYGASKVLGEVELQRLASKNLKYYVIRTSKLFGPRGDSANSKESFFDLMLRIADNRSEVNVVNEELSCFTYTPDLAMQTRNILEKKNDFGFYHVTNSDPAIWYDAARELFSLKGLNIKVNPVSASSFPRPAKRPKYSVLSNSKIPNLRSWKEALGEYLKNYK